MFGLGMPEILLILAIALIVIGPKKLPDLAKTLGRAMGEFKRSAQDFKRSIDVETTIKDLNEFDSSKPESGKKIEDAGTKKQTQAADEADGSQKTIEKPSHPVKEDIPDDENPAESDNPPANHKND